MIYKDYFLKKNITQEIFNKKLNWYFDIKSILYQKKNFFNEETVLHAKILKKDYLKLNITKNIKTQSENTNMQHVKNAFTLCLLFLFVCIKKKQINV